MVVRADPIADLRSPTGSMISLYVERPSPGGFAALLSDLLRPLKERSASMGRAVQKSVRVDSERIHELADRLEIDAAPAYAVFASDMDDVFVVQPLSHPVSSVSSLGPRPYLRPLRAAPRDLRAGVVVADHGLARTFLGSAGIVEEIGRPIDADIGKDNFGGFAGYEEHGVRSRAAEAANRMWRAAVQRLLDIHIERPLDYVAIGGQEETIEEVARLLHPYLAQLPRQRFNTTPNGSSEASIRAELDASDAEIREQRQMALAGRVCDTAWSGGNAVVGLRESLDAANATAIDTLVVAGDFRRGGAICTACGHMTRSGTACPVCSHPLLVVEDVVAALMEAVVSAGGRVVQIGVASPLDGDGVGALTRFPVAG